MVDKLADAVQKVTEVFCMRRLIASLIIVLCILAALSCGFPSEEKVKSEFREAYPAYQPISAIVGEGHGDAAYYHIRYKKPDDDLTYEQVWLYLRGDDNKIRLYHKERETVVR